MYVCGITPYDATHLGHAATYIAFDLVQRVWLDNGHRVHFVQNITDIDDPLLERAARDGIDWRDLAAREIQLFREDMTALRVLPPQDYIGAVEAMDEVSAAVQTLLDSGAAYRVRRRRTPRRLLRHRVGAEVRLRVQVRPGHHADAVGRTWRRPGPAREAEPARPAAVAHRTRRVSRPGRHRWVPAGPAGTSNAPRSPGNRLGPTIDVQGGGSDLIFPHHECSAAHSEVLTGVAPFARHYAHAGMISLDGEKMSKSRGNLVFVSTLRAEGVDPAAIRLALLAGHYRADRPWSADLLDQASERLAALAAGREAHGCRRRRRAHARCVPRWPTTWTRRPRWPCSTAGRRTSRSMGRWSPTPRTRCWAFHWPERPSGQCRSRAGCVSGHTRWAHA